MLSAGGGIRRPGEGNEAEMKLQGWCVLGGGGSNPSGRVSVKKLPRSELSEPSVVELEWRQAR